VKISFLRNFFLALVWWNCFKTFPR